MKSFAYMLVAGRLSSLAWGERSCMAGETQAEDLPGPLASADPTPDLGYDELWRLQNDFYGRWISPNNIKEAESINSTIFADNARPHAPSPFPPVLTATRSKAVCLTRGHLLAGSSTRSTSSVSLRPQSRCLSLAIRTSTRSLSSLPCETSPPRLPSSTSRSRHSTMSRCRLSSTPG